MKTALIMIPRSTNRFCGFAATLVAIFYLVGCEPAPKAWAPKPGTIEYKITQIGDGVVAARYPKYDRKRFPMRVTEESDRWIFSYKLDDNMMGGTPTVEIDKRTLKVVDVYHAQ
jgi:hypothetical protein